MRHDGRHEFATTAKDNLSLCRDHFRLTLWLRSFPPTAPGQFVQIACRDPLEDLGPEHELHWEPNRPVSLHGGELVSPTALLRRPFSLAGRRDTPEGTELDIIYRIVGTGTRWLGRLRPGDAVSLIGPLGNGFQPPPPGATAILVGGGVGLPPMLYLASTLKGRAIAFCGAISRELLPLTPVPGTSCAACDSFTPTLNIAEFAHYGIPSVITTDDGSYGFRGYVTHALERYLDSALSTQHSALVVYTCGPEPMMKRVAEIAIARNIPCHVSVERAMACGMGTCQSCCIRVRKPDPAAPPLPGSDWCYRLACTDGPIFQAIDLLW